MGSIMRSSFLSNVGTKICVKFDSHPDGPVKYLGSYTSVASVISIERRLKKDDS